MIAAERMLAESVAVSTDEVDRIAIDGVALQRPGIKVGVERDGRQCD
jgi:hypothetical protein